MSGCSGAAAAMLLSGLAMLAAPAWSADVPAAGASAPVHYGLDQAKSTLQFEFTQAGARDHGAFRRFTVTLDFSPDNPGASRLAVTIDMNSLDTGDQERDDTLRSADLFAVQKFPQSRFTATQIVKTAAGYEAIGKLTLRDATHDLHVPFTFRTATEQGAAVGYMSGKTTLKRLDYGVGQGDWKATDQVGNDVVVSFTLRLTAAH
ncbi:MAG TPA: YceI family protein [Steroidobacteraceae bacterium]|jgi:polyisoprenoid-binding protein YceI|nr:YceI family protein [Steroidobacteraceae bacterium]